LNARDAMPEGGQLTIATSNRAITAGDPPPGHYVEIRISDTGTGMPPEVLQRAFEPFFTTKDSGGTGLSQVRAMAQEAGGEARLASQPGEGTTVTLLLPRAATETDAAASTPRGAPERKDFQSCLVLAVDDDLAVRQVTVDMLREMGCEVLQAGGGSEALALLDRTS